MPLTCFLPDILDSPRLHSALAAQNCASFVVPGPHAGASRRVGDDGEHDGHPRPRVPPARLPAPRAGPRSAPDSTIPARPLVSLPTKLIRTGVGRVRYRRLRRDTMA